MPTLLHFVQLVNRNSDLNCLPWGLLFCPLGVRTNRKPYFGHHSPPPRLKYDGHCCGRGDLRSGIEQRRGLVLVTVLLHVLPLPPVHNEAGRRRGVPPVLRHGPAMHSISKRFCQKKVCKRTTTKQTFSERQKRADRKVCAWGGENSQCASRTPTRAQRTLKWQTLGCIRSVHAEIAIRTVECVHCIRARTPLGVKWAVWMGGCLLDSGGLLRSGGGRHCKKPFGTVFRILKMCRFSLSPINVMHPNQTAGWCIKAYF